MSSENGGIANKTGVDMFSSSSNMDIDDAKSNNIDSAIESVVAAATASAASPEERSRSPKPPEKIPDLPTNLPTQLLVNIDKLKQVSITAAHVIIHLLLINPFFRESTLWN